MLVERITGRIEELVSGSLNGFGSHRVRATSPDYWARAAHCVYIMLYNWLYTTRYGVVYSGSYKLMCKVVYGPSYRCRYTQLPALA